MGAIATQANVNVGYGPRGLELLRQGLSAKEVLAKLQAEDTFPGKDGRQVAIIDGKGNIATYTGPNAPNWAGDRQGKTWSAQGNILVGPQVPEAMGRAFEATDGELAEKLFAALKAGDDAGGDSRGKQSASMIVVRKGGGRNTNNDRYLYLNVDDNPAPIPELRRLLDMNLGHLVPGEGRTSDSAGQNQRSARRRRRRSRSTCRPRRRTEPGILDYNLSDKPAALADFRKAIELDATLPAGSRARPLPTEAGRTPEADPGRQGIS